MWLLFGGLAAAISAYYFWPEAHEVAESEVGRDEQTRKQAKPLIAMASDKADEQFFTLMPMPMIIKVSDRLTADVADARTLDETMIKDSLWVQQRAMITRLESEFDYSQQADVSEHFAIAAPANQPGSLLVNTLGDLETMLGKIRRLLQLPGDCRLWHGQALILMLSTRKLFDHVAWLTGAGHAQSAPGAFMLDSEDVVLMAIYATRVELFGTEDDEKVKRQKMQVIDSTEVATGRPAVKSVFEASCGRLLLLQVCRAVVCSVGGPRTPKWMEFGMAHWLADQILGKVKLAEGETPVQWEAKSAAIFDAQQWFKAIDDSNRPEQLLAWSSLYVNRDETKSSKPIVAGLKQLRFASDDAAKAILVSLESQF